jgi:putative phosphonate metabolism protein
MRAALYYAPAEDDPLWQAGCRWLGRDPVLNVEVVQPAIEGVSALTADPRRYGFHATLKPPMRFVGGLSALEEAAAAVAGRVTAFPLPRLRVANLDGFLALVPAEPCPALHDLADVCVTALDGFRVPPDDAELVRRRRASLSERESVLLERWGYPYVLDCWRFHMTLTHRLGEADAARLLPLAEGFFRSALALPRMVSSLSVFVEDGPGAPFRLVRRLAFSHAV